MRRHYMGGDVGSLGVMSAFDPPDQTPLQTLRLQTASDLLKLGTPSMRSKDGIRQVQGWDTSTVADKSRQSLSVEDAASHAADNAVTAAHGSTGRHGGSANSYRAIRPGASGAIDPLRADDSLSVMSIA